MQNRKFKLLIGVSGSIAACKVPELLLLLIKSQKFDIQVILTKNSLYFIDLNTIKSMFQDVTFYQDADEWNWQKIGDKVLHIELRQNQKQRKWADFMIIVPLSANTLAKITNGLCDNLLTCVFRAWDFSKKVMVAPAMNTYMYENQITENQIKILQQMKVQIIDPVSKLLACGDTGNGALASCNTIIDAINKCID